MSTTQALSSGSLAQTDLAARFLQVRQLTLDLCAGLSAEDMMVQAMPDASPSRTRWSGIPRATKGCGSKNASTWRTPPAAARAT